MILNELFLAGWLLVKGVRVPDADPSPLAPASPTPSEKGNANDR